MATINGVSLSLSSLFSSSYFSPRRDCPWALKFCMGSLFTKKLAFQPPNKFLIFFGSEIFSLNSEGLEEMFDCLKVISQTRAFQWCRWGTEWSVACAQTWDRGPTSALTKTVSVTNVQSLYCLWTCFINQV